MTDNTHLISTKADNAFCQLGNWCLKHQKLEQSEQHGQPPLLFVLLNNEKTFTNTDKILSHCFLYVQCQTFSFKNVFYN